MSDATCLESRLAELSCGVLVVGHGTRKPQGQRQLLELVSHIQAMLPSTPIAGSFLELAEPGIRDGVLQLKELGCRALIVVPILLFTAGHAKSDIPDAVLEASNEFEIRMIGQSSALETHPSVVELSRVRFEEVIPRNGRPTDFADVESAACPVGGCAAGGSPTGRCGDLGSLPEVCRWSHWKARVNFSGLRVGLAMIGRGTSDEAALHKMRELTQLRCIGTSLEWSDTGFFAGGKPTVDELLERARGSGCDVIVVQPHLLFEGELMDQLREKVRTQSERSGPDWWLARTLGADPMLARVYCTLLADVPLPR